MSAEIFSRAQVSITSRAVSTPARWPATRGRWRRWAQRPLPSMMIAMCWGNRRGSSSSSRRASSRSRGRSAALSRSDAFTDRILRISPGCAGPCKQASLHRKVNTVDKGSATGEPAMCTSCRGVARQSAKESPSRGPRPHRARTARHKVRQGSGRSSPRWWSTRPR